MFMDIKLNKMQHSVATLEKLCKRYHMYKDKNPLLVGTKWSKQDIARLWLEICDLSLSLS